MNAPILPSQLETDAIRAVLRPCAILSRPIPCQPADQIARIGGQR
jgi:hypothetical protein